MNLGKYDPLDDPLYVTPGVDYICFTDDYNYKSDVWKIRVVENRKFEDNRLEVKYYKLFPHEVLPEYDVTIFFDSKLHLWGDFNDCLKSFWDGMTMLYVPHPATNDIYDEINSCVCLGLITDSTASKISKVYVTQGMPKHNGLTDTCCIVRSKDDTEASNVCEKWMDMIMKYSSRDQLSFTYVCWKNKYRFNLMDIYSKANKYYYVKNHKQTREII